MTLSWHRFVSADTVIDGVNTTAGWNRYMYVKGNPIMYKDPTGHFICGGIMCCCGCRSSCQQPLMQSSNKP